MSARSGLSTLYFGFASINEHGAGCSRAGTDVWEVTRHNDLAFSVESWDKELREATLRMACTECGVITFYMLKPDADLVIPTEHTTTGAVGWGSRPERVLGLWLHAGPPIWPGDERGPLSFYVTRTRERPRRPEDCVGVVGWHLGKRHGVRWGAGLHPTDHGTVERNCGDDDFATRHAAVRWLAKELAAEAAAVGA